MVSGGMFQVSLFRFEVKGEDIMHLEYFLKKRHFSIATLYEISDNKDLSVSSQNHREKG